MLGLTLEGSGRRQKPLREVFEEIGVMLAEGANRLTAAPIAEARRQLAAGEKTLLQIIRAHDLALAGDALEAAGRWVTPPFAPRRFDTWFFLAWLPENQEALVDAGELETAEWIRPAEAFARWQRGEIFFKHAGKNNDKVRINYFVPRGQRIWIVGDNIILYQEATGTAYTSSRRAQASKNGEYAFVATPYTSVPDLKRQYNITHVGDEGGMAKLELTPKGKSSLQKLTLWVDQGSWLPTKYQVAEANNNVTTFTLSNLRINGVISDNIFKPEYPAGTKKVNR